MKSRSFQYSLLTLASAGLLSAVAWAGNQASETPPPPVITDAKLPESVATGPDGRSYVSIVGERDVDGDGMIGVIEEGKLVPFATGLNDPKGIVRFGEFLFVTDKDRILKIDRAGKVAELAPASAFPTKPKFLNDITADEKGTLYATDSGDIRSPDNTAGAIYRIAADGKVTLVADHESVPVIRTPNGILTDGMFHVLIGEMSDGGLYLLNVDTKKVEKLADGLGKPDGIVRDDFGRLWVSDVGGGKVYAIPRPGEAPVLLQSGFESANDIGLAPSRKDLMVPDMKGGKVYSIAAVVPGTEVDESPLPLKPEVAFPNLKWTGWSSENDSGEIVPLRPIVLTHAGDESNRVFVATQRGVIHSFPNDQAATETNVYLDIQDRVVYSDKQNEEGFLGLAFHPRYKETGEFFVYYTRKQEPQTSYISRFKVSAKDPNKADPDSEEVLMKIKQPFWNHNGGTVAFGPDGYLYIGIGDGGAANDPHGNGQNLGTLLGSMMRIDVDHKDPGLNYAIPKDNPFVGKEGARPEIWAYGFRNLWRMSFDKKTGQCWAADVGQNLWEEIDLVEKGGNYGWNIREALEPFSVNGTGPRPEYIDPVWEYHHDIGKSITGGNVYRGTRLPELAGAYLYADYVSGKTWALRYDFDQKRVVANQPIADQKIPVLSFGEDEKGETYFLTYSPSGKGIYRFVHDTSATSGN